MQPATFVNIRRLRVSRGALSLVTLVLVAVGFTLDLVYGTYGIMGFYEINNPVYVTLVIVSALGAVTGAALSLLLICSA